jgi:hypothetical protein
MGEQDSAEHRVATAILGRDNPGRPDQVRMYVDQFLAYREADRDIAARGQVLGEKQNPSVIVRLAARRAMSEMKLRGSGRLWEIFEQALEVERNRAGGPRRDPS